MNLTFLLSPLLLLCLAPPQGPPGMVWIEGGAFTMGGVGPEVRRDELPRHRVKLDGFFISAHEITNQEFKAFVDDTGYKTVAERAVDWDAIKEQVPPGTPKPLEEMLKPGSLVFHIPEAARGTQDISQWWTWTTGADWLHPEGPASKIDGRWDHPVVQVAWADAVAYAKWAGGQLPTEAQWEYAARGGVEDMPFIWGDGALDPTRANVWQGTFPTTNTKDDGFVLTAPVGTFPPNGYGLYDMGGNVWEWCSDIYSANIYEGRKDVVTEDPRGPEKPFDPRNPFAPDVRVQRGGSFLCNPSYCSSYRPSARMSTTPDSAMSHAGFRVVMTQEQADAKSKKSKDVDRD
jgi:formylglycine-generating enzyme required for sulfatase activity